MNLGKSLNLSEPVSSSVKWGYNSICCTGWRHLIYLPSCAPNKEPLLSQPFSVMMVMMLTIVARSRQCWPCPAAWGVPWEWGFLLRNPQVAQPWHAAGDHGVHLVPLILVSAFVQNFSGFSEKTPRSMVAVCRESLGVLFPFSAYLPQVFAHGPCLPPHPPEVPGAQPPAPPPAQGPWSWSSGAWILAGIRGDGGGADGFCPQAS